MCDTVTIFKSMGLLSDFRRHHICNNHTLCFTFLIVNNSCLIPGTFLWTLLVQVFLLPRKKKTKEKPWKPLWLSITPLLHSFISSLNKYLLSTYQRTRLKQASRIKHGQDSHYSDLCLASHNSDQTGCFEAQVVFYFFFNCWCSACTIYDILANILMVLKAWNEDMPLSFFHSVSVACTAPDMKGQRCLGIMESIHPHLLQSIFLIIQDISYL